MKEIGKKNIDRLKFIGYILLNVVIFVFPFGLKLLISRTAFWITGNDGYEIVLQDYILDEITYLVLSPSLIILTTCLFYSDKIKDRLGDRYAALAKILRFFCAAISIILIVLIFFVTLNIGRDTLLACCMFILIIEGIGAGCCVVLQCLTHPEVYTT